MGGVMVHRVLVLQGHVVTCLTPGCLLLVWTRLGVGLGERQLVVPGVRWLMSEGRGHTDAMDLRVREVRGGGGGD